MNTNVPRGDYSSNSTSRRSLRTTAVCESVQYVAKQDPRIPTGHGYQARLGVSVKLGNIGDTVAVGVWPVPDSSVPHTQLGRSQPKYGAEPQAREWQHGSHGQPQPTRDMDFPDHGTLSIHPNLRRRSGSCAEDEFPDHRTQSAFGLPIRFSFTMRSPSPAMPN